MKITIAEITEITEITDFFFFFISEDVENLKKTTTPVSLHGHVLLTNRKFHREDGLNSGELQPTQNEFMSTSTKT